MFLMFSDHLILLFPIIANHRSSDEMFAMYRSSLMSRFLCEDFVQHSYHIIADYEEGRRSIIGAARGPQKVSLTLYLVHLTMLTSSLNNILGQKFPICQLLDLDPGGVWGSTHKCSAKSVVAMALFVCFCLQK